VGKGWKKNAESLLLKRKRERVAAFTRNCVMAPPPVAQHDVSLVHTCGSNQQGFVCLIFHFVSNCDSRPRFQLLRTVPLASCDQVPSPFNRGQGYLGVPKGLSQVPVCRLPGNFGLACISVCDGLMMDDPLAFHYYSGAYRPNGPALRLFVPTCRGHAACLVAGLARHDLTATILPSFVPPRCLSGWLVFHEQVMAVLPAPDASRSTDDLTI
jgi:hypothetical protein